MVCAIVWEKLSSFCPIYSSEDFSSRMLFLGRIPIILSSYFKKIAFATFWDINQLELNDKLDIVACVSTTELHNLKQPEQVFILWIGRGWKPTKIRVVPTSDLESSLVLTFGVARVHDVKTETHTSCYRGPVPRWSLKGKFTDPPLQIELGPCCFLAKQNFVLFFF
jgi:hypothetical protein